MNNALNLGVGGGLSLGGGSSPFVMGAGTAPASIADVAYGAGSTTGSDNTGSLVGATPGHLAWYLGTAALILLALVRHSLPR